MAQASYLDTARRLASFLAKKARFVTTSNLEVVASQSDHWASESLNRHSQFLQNKCNILSLWARAAPAAVGGGRAACRVHCTRRRRARGIARAYGGYRPRYG
eukprot:COSAG02_NODE_7111_length_3179_cov_2.701299_3_plen_102_part_00